MRFPGFTDEWETHRLSSYAKKITKKNKGNEISNVLCNSANLGIIPQSEYFDRDIANSENTDNYYIIEPGDFVYNPRKSVTAPYGPVNLYIGTGLGIISPLYLCFKVDNLSKEFLLHWFKGYSWHRYVYSHGDTGVRYDRVSIKDDVFLDMPISLPSICEQNIISTLLTLIDERIATQNKIIEDLKSVISSISNKLFDGKMHIGDSNDEWVYMTLGDITTNFNRRNKVCQHLPMFSVTNISGFSPQNEVFEGKEIKDEDISIYKIIHKGEFAYNPARINVGSIGRYEGDAPCMISSLYICFRPKDNIDSDWLQYLLKSNKMVYQYGLYGEGGVRIYLFYPNFSRIKVWVPPLRTQEKIASILNSFKDKLFLETSFLRRLQEQKRYLLTRMFI